MCNDVLQYAGISFMTDLKSYFSGYVDGEGCFCVSMNKSSRHMFGWEVRPSFSVSQNSGRAEVLRMLRSHFKCGSIRPDRSDKTIKYEVRSLENLIKSVIPHFEQNPLLSSKSSDFELFAKICRMMSKKKHHTITGFSSIIDLAFRMNPSGIRKYSKKEIKI